MSIDTAYNARPARVRVPLCPPGWSLPSALRADALAGRCRRNALVERIAVELQVEPTDVILCSSGMDALTRALKPFFRNRDDEVIVSTFNCPAVVAATTSAGMRPVLCDIGRDLRLDPETVEAAITPRTRAVIASHLFGHDVGIESLARLCKERGIALVDDAAQAFGGHAAGRALGAWGDVGILSFGKHKPLYAGRGGALIHGNPNSVVEADEPGQRRWSSTSALLTDRLCRVDTRIPRMLGLARPLADDVADDLERTELSIAQGGMTDANVSLTLSGLDRWHVDVARSVVHQDRLTDVVNRWRGRVSLVRELPPSGPGNLFPIACDGIGRRDLANRLTARGVETTWLYFPLHLVRRYARVSRCPGAPVAEQRAREILCLPARASLGDRQFEHLIAALDDSIDRCNPSRRIRT